LIAQRNAHQSSKGLRNGYRVVCLFRTLKGSRVPISDRCGIAGLERAVAQLVEA
jgi:hypothetical protein